MVREMVRPTREPAKKGELIKWAELIFSAAVATGSLVAGTRTCRRPSRSIEVKGSVVLEDGKPLTSGTVEFEPVSGSVYQASGEIGPDGSFSLKTADSGDGAAPGEYRVKVVPDETHGPFRYERKDRRSRDLSKLPFARKYLDADTSELRATVKAEPNQLEAFKLSKSSGSAVPRIEGVSRAERTGGSLRRRSCRTRSLESLTRPLSVSSSDFAVPVPTHERKVSHESAAEGQSRFPSVHAHRAPGGHRDHRGPDRPASSRRSIGSGSRTQGPVHKQLETDGACTPQLSQLPRLFPTSGRVDVLRTECAVTGDAVRRRKLEPSGPVPAVR